MFNRTSRYKTRKGFLKKHGRQELTDGVLYIYPTGVFVIEYGDCNITKLEAEPQGSPETTAVFNVLGGEDKSGYYQFICIQ
jgi:hypothetical protein